MAFTSLLETAHGSSGVPTIVMGVLALVVLIGALAWVVGMGSGRPHSK